MLNSLPPPSVPVSLPPCAPAALTCFSPSDNPCVVPWQGLPGPLSPSLLLAVYGTSSKLSSGICPIITHMSKVPSPLTTLLPHFQIVSWIVYKYRAVWALGRLFLSLITASLTARTHRRSVRCTVYGTRVLQITRLVQYGFLVYTHSCPLCLFCLGKWRISLTLIPWASFSSSLFVQCDVHYRTKVNNRLINNLLTKYCDI